jgi:hypothetical protein
LDGLTGNRGQAVNFPAQSSNRGCALPGNSLPVLCFRGPSGRPQPKGNRKGNRIVGSVVELLRYAGPLWRSTGLEWIYRPASFAFKMAEDAIDDARIPNDGDDLHRRPTTAQQGVRLENLSNETRPSPSSILAEFRVSVPRFRLHGCSRRIM